MAPIKMDGSKRYMKESPGRRRQKTLISENKTKDRTNVVAISEQLQY
jgi:hypothetical protein